MDPNANLAEQERLLTYSYAEKLSVFGGTPREAACRYVDRQAELRAALRAWLTSGGAEPDWTKAPNARKYYGR
jgi:hypothetical protein